MDKLETASNLAGLAGVNVFGLVSMITQAALTARQNGDACRELADRVREVEGLLRMLETKTLPLLRQHEATRRSMEQFDNLLRNAYLLVRSCGEVRPARDCFSQLLTAKQTAEKLSTMQRGIDRFIQQFSMLVYAATEESRPVVQVRTAQQA